ncbi:MAG: hypothetical protein KJO83_01130, partial [Bacteroidia bacterium]|nr:hypothetical protein [Bacteroidia bacterium]
MKTILSLLLLPIILIAQPYGQHQNERFDIEFSVEMTMEPIITEKMGSLNMAEGTIELLVMVEVYLQEFDGSKVNPLPKYLNTFSLIEWPAIREEGQRPKERLNGLLALNDPAFPKEDTLLGGLLPVRYERNL